VPEAISENVRQSFALAQSLRLPWEGRWQRLVDVAMPYRTHFWSRQRQGENPGTVYDETGVVAIEECGSRLQDAIMPAGVEWARYRPGPAAPQGFEQLLAEWQAELFDQMNESNLYAELPDCFKDLAGFGNWCIRVDGGGWRNPLEFQAYSLADVWITPGKGGGIGDIHTRQFMPGYVVRATWPHAKLKDERAAPETMHEVIDSWIQDLTGATPRWMFECHVNGYRLGQGEASGTGSCPYVFGRWSKNAGELYATGQGMQVLAAIEVVNEAMRLILAHGDLALSGMWQAEDDGVLNPWSVRLAPGAILAKAPGSRGLEPLQFATSRLDIGQLVLSEQRFAIRKGLFNETLGAREGTPPSATEVEVRMQELARQVGPQVQRVWREFCVPLLERCRFVLKGKGLLPMPAVDGRQMRIAPVSALVRAAAQGELGKLDRMLGGLKAHYGDQAAATVVPADRYASFAARKLDIPANVMLDPQERKRVAARMANQMNEAVQDPQAGLAPLMATMAESGGGPMQ
jgi:hypothetical protein